MRLSPTAVGSNLRYQRVMAAITKYLSQKSNAHNVPLVALDIALAAPPLLQDRVDIFSPKRQSGPTRSRIASFAPYPITPANVRF
jgi:hypothetical protein